MQDGLAKVRWIFSLRRYFLSRKRVGEDDRSGREYTSARRGNGKTVFFFYYY